MRHLQLLTLKQPDFSSELEGGARGEEEETDEEEGEDRLEAHGLWWCEDREDRVLRSPKSF